MMLYANSKGVVKNTEAALYFGEEAVAEQSVFDAISLSKTSPDNNAKPDIDYCDGRLELISVFFCNQLDLLKDQDKWQKQINELKKNWSDDVKNSYEELLNATKEIFPEYGGI